MSKNPFLYVSEEFRSINEYAKNNVGLTREEIWTSKVEERVENLMNYAQKNGVPLQITAEEIIEKVVNTEIGIPEDESYEESYDESY